MASRAPADLARTKARPRYLTDSGVHRRVESVVTREAESTAEIKAERARADVTQRRLRDATANADRLTAAAAFDASVTGRSSASVAESLRFRDEKQVREMRIGYRVVAFEHLMRLDAEERARVVRELIRGIEKSPEDVKAARAAVLTYLLMHAVRDEEAERDRAAIVVEGVPTDEHGEGGL